MRRLFSFFLSLCVLISGFSISTPVLASSLAQQLSGKILLQVEQNGEAWYIYPESNTRFFMGRPADAFDLMRNLGLGISTANLEQIPEVGQSFTGNYALRQQVSGKILLQVEENGEAWYINPENLQRYYMGRPADAFNLMRNLGLGISDENLAAIPIDPTSVLPEGVTPPPSPDADLGTAEEALLTAINKERNTNGLGNYALSNELTAAAQAQADDMKAKNYFDFTSPTGETMENFMAQVGYQPYTWSNNIIQTNQGAKNIVNVWKQQGSESLQSVLSAEYKEIGLGVGEYQGVPVYIVVFARSVQDYFETETADLADLNAVRTQMLLLLNERRAQEGLSALVMNDLLEQSAQGHADDMFNRSYYAHETPEGLTSFDRIIATGYNPQATGENIAKGQLSVQEVMTAWFESPEHLANILSPNFTEVGFGLQLGKNLNGYETLWVQNFGNPM